MGFFSEIETISTFSGYIVAAPFVAAHIDRTR